MVYAKVCGLKNPEQIEKAIELGYDAVGIVLAPFSKRYVEKSEAEKLAKMFKGEVDTFAVGVTYDHVSGLENIFDYIQISETVEAENLILSIKEKPSAENKLYIYDASMGQGVFSEIPKWVEEYRDNLIIAGGLDSLNVAEVIKKYCPYGVDVSSGVETDGIKDYKKMEEFICAVREADCEHR